MTVGTCREEVLDAVRALESRGQKTFRVLEILTHMQKRGTSYAESTIRTHVTSRMCGNAPDNHGTTYNDLERVGPGEYKRRR